MSLVFPSNVLFTMFTTMMTSSNRCGALPTPQEGKVAWWRCFLSIATAAKLNDIPFFF